MRILVTESLKNYKGISVKQTNLLGEELKDDLTYRDVFATALNGYARDEQPVAEVKAKAFQLSTKLYEKKEVDLTLDERALIKERVNKIYASPLICGRVAELLEEKK